MESQLIKLNKNIATAIAAEGSESRSDSVDSIQPRGLLGETQAGVIPPREVGVIMNDKQILYQAVCLWKNYIETSDPLTNKSDLLKLSYDKDIQRKLCTLPKLTIEQEYFVNKLESLKKEILNDKFTKEI
jgi:hypothetical protein